MTKKFWKWAVGGLLVGAIAWAAAEQRVDRYGGQFPLFLNKGLYVGTEAASRNPTIATTNKLTGMYAQTFDYDFPSTTNGYVAVSSGKTLTLTGVKLGDPCTVGIGKATPSDGGAAWIPFVTYQAVAIADNTISILAHMDVTDGGAEDLPDAGYNIRCFSNQ